MIESLWNVFRDSIALINLPFTILLAGIVFYWLLVLVGMIDFDLPFFDGGPEGADGIDAHAEGGGDEGILQPILKFFNVGEAPIMIVATISVLSLWLLAILINRSFNPQHEYDRALLLVLPNLLGTALITHLAAKPFARMNRYLNSDFDKAPPMVGLIGTVMTSTLDNKFGTINIDIKGAPLTVQARSEEGQVFKQGERVQIVREDKSSGIYYVARN